LPQPLNDEFLLAYNSLIPNSKFARVHQQMIQERRQQQLAQEEAAELRERVRTALAKAIAAFSQWFLDQADPLPVPTTGGSPGDGSTAPFRIVLGRSRKKFSHKNKIYQGRHGGRHAPKRTSNPSYGPRRPGLAAAQHQSIEGQGLSMPIIAIQNLSLSLSLSLSLFLLVLGCHLSKPCTGNALDFYIVLY
jgi:hypothetical protein